MPAHLLLLVALLALSACQSVSTNSDYDPARDFSAYRSWSWQAPAVQYAPADPRLDSDLTTARIRQAVAEQLDQRGLRPAQPGSAADLRVQVWMLVEQRQEQFSSGYGGAWNGPWGGYWGGPAYIETRTLNYQVGTLQIDLIDGKDGQLVWRGSGERTLRSSSASPAERSALIHETVAKVLSTYPPN
ncbi:MAG: DUF4136 domain-containing protein [Pseudomonas sp.]